MLAEPLGSAEPRLKITGLLNERCMCVKSTFLIDIELSVLDGGKSSKLREQISQGVNKPDGERARGRIVRRQSKVGYPDLI